MSAFPITQTCRHSSHFSFFLKDFFFLMIFLRCLDLYGIKSLTIHTHDR